MLPKIGPAPSMVACKYILFVFKTDFKVVIHDVTFTEILNNE